MKLLNQKRVRKVPSALSTSGVAQVRLIVPVDREIDGLKKYHLSALQEVGDQMIPAAHGTATRRNIEGREIIHRSQPLEKHFWQVLWGREQFCGRDETEWVEDYVTRSGWRYPRTQLRAEDVEIALLENAAGKQFFGTEFISIDAEERLVTAINVMLEIFGEIWIADAEDLNLPLIATKRVGWKLLPQGKRGWEAVRPELDAVVDSMKNKVHRNRAKRSLKSIYQHEPKDVVVGEGGFHGYVGFCFPDRGFTVLESIHPNNATYILGENWEALSRLTKGEILEGKLQLARLIHDQSWSMELGKWFADKAA